MNNNSFAFYLDDVTSSLDQIDALVTVAMHANITELRPKTFYNYFAIISDILTDIRLKQIKAHP